MKRINLIILAFVIIATSINAQTGLEKVFRKYKNDEGVVSLSFSGDLTRMIQNKDLKLKTKIDNCEVLIFSNKENVSKSDEAKIKTAIAVDKYDLLMNVKNKTTKANVYAVAKGDALSKVYAAASMDNKTYYLILSGNIYFDELSKLNLDFQGAEGLKNVFGGSTK
jgi:hypothetical protein